MSDVRLNMKNLEQLAKAFKSNGKLIKVGIFGGGGSHSGEGGLTNAEVGAFHELDEERSVMPRRSFLQIPLETQFTNYLARSKLMRSKAVVQEMVQTGEIQPLIETMKVTALRVVDEAFDTSGFGTWPASDMSRKKNHQTLIETGSLEEAIAAEEASGG